MEKNRGKRDGVNETRVNDLLRRREIMKLFRRSKGSKRR